jgi:RimJ/RimL family protein N-acetyltransferase
MENPFWPLFDLRIRTPRVEIRLPTDTDLVALAHLAQRGVHDPDAMPFLKAWTDAPSPDMERGLLQWGWRHRAQWHTDKWTFSGAVFVNGEVVGVQDLMATDFATLRSVKTGSWLGIEHHSQGIGKEMRSAMLHFAFTGLGALVTGRVKGARLPRERPSLRPSAGYASRNGRPATDAGAVGGVRAPERRD